MRLHCIELPVPSPEEAGRWLESVLHFLPVDDGRLYVCGNFRLRLVTAEGDAPSRAPDKIVGLEHIALETPDAGALLRALLSKGLELEHDRGVPFFNPKVFGTGTKYFNLIAPFGTKFEFCQRLDKDYPSDSSEILGLEHIGLSAHDFAASFRELSAYGFRPQFAPVENDTPHG
uniref:VOC family protein n=1 Tax=Alistipes ihumii TaxID=1470347 RepID=UPI003FF08A82